jgi:hypothetical protein
MSDDDDELAALRRERNRRLGASKVKTFAFLFWMEKLSDSGCSCDDHEYIYEV